MSVIQHQGKSYTVSDEVAQQYPELIKMVLQTESMDHAERQYWFDILPSMTDDQVDRLFDILETERRKLAELEQKYQDEIQTLNEKHLIEWQEFQMKSSRDKIQEAESQEADQNIEEAEAILDEL